MPSMHFGRRLVAAGEIARPAVLDEEPPAPPLANRVEDDVRQPRAYPQQPPVIPHNIEGANRCLTCHGRQSAELVELIEAQ